MNTIRQDAIRSYIEEKSVATIKELHALFPEVSLMTIHRDLDALVIQGAIVKIRGGAKSVRHTGDIGFDIRLRENVAGKLVMVRKALSLIAPHASVFLDAGTTNLMLARQLPDEDFNIFTTGPNIAIALCRLQKPNITLCCGNLNRKNMALSGPNTQQMLESINLDIAFIGVSGCYAETGFTCGTEADMVIKRSVIRRARKSVMMCDSTKFSRLMPFTFASFSDVDYLICDREVPEHIAKAARDHGVTVL